MNRSLQLALLFAASVWSVDTLAAQCSDGLDNDGDGLIDYPAEPGCYDASDDGEANPPSITAVTMPSLQDERDTYTLWGWTWTQSDEPDHQAAPGYTVANVDIHGDSEGDDLWSYIMMFIRTNQRGYLDRARAWAAYFKNDYYQCILGTSKADLCDETAWGLDHFYGWGLLAWYEYTGDPAALAAAEQLGALQENHWADAVPGVENMTFGGGRKPGRHLLFATRLAAVTGDARWIALRDKLIDLIMQSPSWHSYGMYHFSKTSTDFAYGPELWASGVRIMTSYHIGILAEAFYNAYLETGRTDVRDRIVDMARFVDQYGLDQVMQYSGSQFGVNIDTGEPWHNYNESSTDFWDPVYTMSTCNLLVLGAKFTGETRLYDRAKYFFNRGTKGQSNYPDPPTVVAPDDEVHHFVDSLFTSPTYFFLSYNKGELQYTYLLFDPELRGPGNTTTPVAPTDLTVN